MRRREWLAPVSSLPFAASFCGGRNQVRSSLRNPSQPEAARMQLAFEFLHREPPYLPSMGRPQRRSYALHRCRPAGILLEVIVADVEAGEPCIIPQCGCDRSSTTTCERGADSGEDQGA